MITRFFLPPSVKTFFYFFGCFPNIVRISSQRIPTFPNLSICFRKVYYHHCIVCPTFCKVNNTKNIKKNMVDIAKYMVYHVKCRINNTREEGGTALKNNVKYLRRSKGY